MNNQAKARLFQQLEAPAPSFVLPASYTFSVLLSLLVSSLLIAVYLVVFAAVGWLTVSLAWNALTSASAGHLFAAGVSGVGGLIAGVMFISLTKPFGLAFASHETPIVLAREEQPLLYAFVDRICQTLDTPKPLEIRLELAPNASAGPASVLAGLVTQNVVLSIGLPLALGLNIQQFAGIVAHELGHFAQSGGGTDLSRLMQVVNAAFGKIVFEQDWFDDLLEKYSHPNDGALANVLAPLRWSNYVCRRFFHLLMLAGHAASSFETRQKEFDADAYETYLSGYDGFRHASRNLELLMAGYENAMNDLHSAWQDRRLMDNLPALAVANATSIPKERQRQLYRLALTRKTQWYDSHPSHAERLQASHRLQLPGIVHNTRPARELFQGIHGLCRQATVSMLRDKLGDKFHEAKLVPAALFLREHEETQRAYTSLRHFYLGKFLIWRPLFPYPVATRAPEDAQKALDELDSRRCAMSQHAEQASAALEELDAADNRLILARQAAAVVELGYRINPGEFELSAGNRENVQFAVKDLRATVGRIGASLEEYDRHARWRLTYALQLIHIRRIYNRLEEATRDSDRQTAIRLVKLCSTLKESQQQLAELRSTIRVVVPLISCINPKQVNPQLVQNITIQCRQVAVRLSAILEPLTKVAYPFDHAQGHVSIAKAISERQPNADNPFDVIDATVTVLERFDSLLARVLATLARIAEKVEAALDLPVLSQPAQRDEVEEFVRKCEEEAKAPKKWNDLAFACTRWALQIGITLLLTLALLICFWVFGSLVSGGGEPTVARQTTAPSGRPSSIGFAPQSPPPRTAPSGNSNSTRPPAAATNLQAWTDFHNARNIYAGYRLALSSQFILQQLRVEPGSNWVAVCALRHRAISQFTMEVRIDRNPEYGVTLFPVMNKRLTGGNENVMTRQGHVYNIRGTTPRTISTPRVEYLCTELNTSQGTHLLLVGLDRDRLIEIRIYMPESVPASPQAVQTLISALQLPP